MPATVKIIWSGEEDELMVKMRLLGRKNQEIADALGRPRSTVGHHLLKLLKELPPEELEKIRIRAVETPPLLRLAVPSPRAGVFWTPEMDDYITKQRQADVSYRRIGEAIGRHESSVWDRVMKLAERQMTAPASSSAFPKTAAPRGRADFFRRPPGPVPANPDPPKSPLDPGYRKCLGADHRGAPYFWSPSGAVRICPNCKRNQSRPDHHGSGSAVADVGSYVLHL